MSVSEFEEGGGAFSVSVFSFWFTRFLLPLWYLLSTNCFTRPAETVFRLPVKSAGRLFLLAAQLLTVHPEQWIGFPALILYSVSPPLNPSSSSVGKSAPVILRQNQRCWKNKLRLWKNLFYFSEFYICFNCQFAFLILWSESKLSSQEGLQMFILKDVLLKAASSEVPS